LILLWERALRVGDWIVVGSDEGFVRRINVRSTEIETFDRAAVIIPNSNLVTGVVKNFVRTDRVGRIRIPIDTDASADPEKVRSMLYEIVKSHEIVLETPEPYISFAGFDSSKLHFEVFCFVADVATLVAAKSDLNFDIFKKFKAQGWLSGPPPSSVVTLAGFDKLEPLLQKVAASASTGGLGKVKQDG
jgi:potassium efflux system protein